MDVRLEEEDIGGGGGLFFPVSVACACDGGVKIDEDDGSCADMAVLLHCFSCCW